MDFAFTPEHEAFRQEVRTFLESELPSGWGPLGVGFEPGSDAAFAFSQQFRKRLASRGWLTIAWPKEYGGLGAPHMQQLIFNEEVAYHFAPGPDPGITQVGPILMLSGSEELKREYLPRISRAEIVWGQGYSEPESGSDLASLQTRAVEDGDDFVINGTKIWTTDGHRATMMYMLVRTDPDAPKHRGITFLLADMKSPGITVRPIIDMAGEHVINQIFFDGVRVPKRNMVGEKNRGWYVGAALLDFERSGVGQPARAQRVLEGLVQFSKETRVNGGALSKNASVRHELAERAIEIEAARLASYRVAWMQSQGQVPNKEASINKLFGSELGQRVAQTGMGLLGLRSQLVRGSKWAAFQGYMARMWLRTISDTIQAGTSEIQRNVIATRGLGLPRA
ncbi:MAG: acyl-CoA dehydrogenase family protein [Chloroflexi bacterium]|nr:acyl-CoA dehydrogenase family protein [Chloroflexota bacterium]